MGSTPSAISPSEFSQQWKISDTSDNLTIWQNKADPCQQLQQYYIHNYDQERTKKLYEIRNESRYLVNAYSLTNDSFACCGDHEGNKVLIERIPLRLSNVQDIPYPDLLHLFDACIHGFPQLTEVVRFFNVDEDQIGVNQKGQVKVWLNTAFESTEIQGNKSVLEGDMLADIFEIFSQTTDPQSYPEHIPELLQFIGHPARNTTFAEVQKKFQSYTHQFTASYVPYNLQCVHSVGGPLQINNWCRSNQSFGFDQNSMRPSERLLQSKLASKSQQAAVPIDSRQVSQVQQNAQVAGPVPQQIGQQQFQPPQLVQLVNSESKEEYVRRAQEQQQARRRRGEQRTVQFIQGPPQTFFYSLQQSNTQPSNAQPLPQPQIYQPQIYQPQQQAQIQPQIQYQSQVQNKPQFQPQPQVQLQPQLQLKPQPQPQRQFLQGTPFITSQPIIQYEQPRIQTISQPFPQAESRLQQQRVISQAIQIKQGSRLKSNANEASPPPYNQSTNAVNSYLSQSNSQPFPQKNETTVQDNLYNYGRAIPFSVNVNEDRYVPASTQDGKSSADFLALLNELKKPSGQGSYNQVYSQVADTPVSNVKEQSSQSSRNKIFSYPNAHQTYSQQAYSNYGQESNRNIEEAEKIFGVRSEVEPNEDYKYGQYNFSKYERSIDPDIRADLLRYQS